LRFSGLSALTGIEVAATRSMTEQPTVPLRCEVGNRHFNVERRKMTNAGFDGLAFELPKGGGQAVGVER
jgi:hypothetical protein